MFCRDDLYRVELDNMAGDEMFYSKVGLISWRRQNTNKHSILIDTYMQYVYFACGSFLLQKRTWESNKNDIRVCRMKGKHEVQGSYNSPHYLHNHTLGQPQQLL